MSVATQKLCESFLHESAVWVLEVQLSSAYYVKNQSEPIVVCRSRRHEAEEKKMT